MLNKLFCMDRAQQQQQAPSASPVARSDPGGSSNNNMWLMWEKTSRMRVEMLHASPSPRRQLKLLQLHLHFQLQFCKSYAKTAEGRARSGLATWLWLFFWPHLSCQLCSGHETIHTLQSMEGGKQEMQGRGLKQTRAVTRCVLGGCSLDC